MSYGLNGRIILSRQETFSNENSLGLESAWAFPFVSETLNESVPHIISEQKKQRFESAQHYEGYHDIGGDIVFNANNNTLGLLLRAWSNAESVVNVDSGMVAALDIYQNKMVSIQTDFNNECAINPYSIYAQRDNQGSDFLYYDMALNQLVIEIAQGAIIKTTASFIGGKFKSVDSFGLTGIQDSIFLLDSNYMFHQCSISLNGVGLDEVVNMTITLNNNLEAVGTFSGTKTCGRIKRAGNRTIEVAGTILYENNSYFDAYKAFTSYPLNITMEAFNVSSDYKNTVAFVFPEFKFREFPVNVSGAGLIEVSFAGDILYHEGSGTMFNISAITEINTY